ncbi:hypothetical protein [Shouchella hunanensis]|uniref:SH3 domain-containing protein n=1 Tax=Shouchella hunanensis TaxID=766894 RepID=A0ABY7W7R9_9BACI|nr:hypothetical protein [Shouchella hunanensis]WDF02760.1 hypothetical protein PQ477_14790 [Shouchella hunanensis]
MSICINRSGRQVPVYRAFSTTRIGTIFPNELFSYSGYDGRYSHFFFRNASGQWVSGANENVPRNFLSNAYSAGFRRSTVTLGGTLYNVFDVRRTANVYRVDGSRWGSVAAGQKIATTGSPPSGNSLTWTTRVNYVRSTSGSWVRVSSGTNTHYGFVDTGIRSGSMPSSIGIYGNW